MISLKDEKNEEATPIVALKNRGNRNASQVWIIRYTDNMGDEAYQKKGEKDADHNMIALEPFYLRSKLPMQRVAECVGANNITLKKWVNNRKAQQF
jgi:hypothetical protein